MKNSAFQDRLEAEPPCPHQPEVADLIVAYIEQRGVEYVFGVPGGAIEPLYNALARSARRGGPRHVLARHEAGAAFMADGYARETGMIGVCCATSGLGATNLLTGSPALMTTVCPCWPSPASRRCHLLASGHCRSRPARASTPWACFDTARVTTPWSPTPTRWKANW